MDKGQNKVYLNTAACGLIPEAAVEAGNDFNTMLQWNSSTRAEHWKTQEAGRIRNTIADFIGAPASNVAMLPNFSFGINCLVQSLKGTEKVLLFKEDYPSLTDPFKINHFDITWIGTKDEFTISLEEINQLLEAKNIDVLAISHVQWRSGFKIDLEQLGKICKQHGVRLIIDATQSLGAMPIDLSALQIDVFIASNYKWMNAGFGTGIMYINDDFLKQYPPVVGGNNSYVLQDGQLVYFPSLRSYEPGHLNMGGLTLLEAAIQDKKERGLEAIARHNEKLIQSLLAQIRDLPVELIGPASMDNRSAILMLKDRNGLGKWLIQHNIVITLRNNNIRISPHYYNNEADINALIQCIRELPAV